MFNLRLPLKSLLIATFATLPACVSSSDYEHLEREDQLHQLETANLKKRVESLTKELQTEHANVENLEKQIAAASVTADENAQALAASEARLAAQVTATAAAERKIQRVREALAGSELSKAPARESLLKELSPPVIPPPPQAPTAEQEPITH